MITVCVVDNEEITGLGIAAALGSALSESSFRISDPVVAVKEVPDATDVVVCDVHLKVPWGTSGTRDHLSGPAAIRYLVDERGLSVVAVSGVVGNATVTATIAAGARSFVSKQDSMRPLVWAAAVTAASEHRYHVTAALAAALLHDADARPLDPRFDLLSQDREYLRDCIATIDDPGFMPRQWQGIAVLNVLDRVWRVSKRRYEAYRLELHPGLIRVAPLLLTGMTQEEAAEAVGINRKTLRGYLNTLKIDWNERYHSSAMSAARQADILKFLYLQYLEENGMPRPESPRLQ